MDCPKFLSIMKALQTNPAVREKKKKMEDDGVYDITPTGTDSDDEKQKALEKCPRPSGNKMAKQKKEEEAIIVNVTSKLKNVNSAGSGRAVAAAINDFSSVLSTFFADWREQTSFQLVDPALRKTYEELKIKERIFVMQQKQKQREEEELNKEQQKHIQHWSQLEKERDELDLELKEHQELELQLEEERKGLDLELEEAQQRNYQLEQELEAERAEAEHQEQLLQQKQLEERRQEEEQKLEAEHAKAERQKQLLQQKKSGARKSVRRSSRIITNGNNGKSDSAKTHYETMFHGHIPMEEPKPPLQRRRR